MSRKIDVVNLLKNEKYIKTVRVPEAAEKTEKYTVYKILLQVTPEKTLDDENYSFVLWRRFRDIHKLYCKLEMVHKQLYLKGQYPEMAKPDFFGRHDPQVVEERRQTTETFLDFVVRNDVLCKTDVLHSFFQGAELEQKASEEAPNAPILIPAPFSLSTSSDDGDDHLDQSDGEDHSTAHPDESLSVFDPCLQVKPSKEPSISNFDLLSTILTDFKVDDYEGSNSSLPQSGTLPQTACLSDIIEPANRSCLPKNESASEITREKLLIPQTLRIVRSAGNLHNISNQQQSLTGSGSSWFKKVTSSPSKKSQQANVPADYLVQAGEFISSAQKSEAEGVYDFAYTLYKSAVLLLLNGVQEEKDLNRRNAVRVQMTKYLRRSEKLYRRYLATDASEEFVIDSLPVRFASDINLIGLHGLYSELKQYRCMGLLGNRVQLVSDSNTNEVFAMKFVDKSCYTNLVWSQCVPVHVPYMVKLVRFWDLDHCVVLLLELAPKGNLWDNLKFYFKSKRQEFFKNCICLFHTPRYSSRKILFHVGDSKPECSSSKRSSMSALDDYTSLIDDDQTYSDLSDKDWIQQKFNEISFENSIRKWAAQIIVAICHLHAEEMICHDLNPSNILLDEHNNVVLSYFCTWHCQHRRLDENCLDHFYCAPEIINVNEDSVSKGCDWWSLGVILYELAVGLPLYLLFPQGINAHSIITFPDDLSTELKDLISKLIRFDVDERLGCGTDGEEILKAHPFFDGINWAKVEILNQ